MSNDLVVQLGAKLDQFQSDLNTAGNMADDAVGRIEDSFSKLNPGLGGFGASFTAAGAAVAGVIALVVELNKNLADMKTTAEQVGLTLRELQGVQFGGQVAGLSTNQINEGLSKSAQLLNDASRNSNSLSKELSANGINIKQSNGQLLTENQLLGIAADLVKKANNPQDKNVVAEMLGFTKEWVPLLEQGSGAMKILGDEAAKAGAVIDDETINRASDFDKQWRKSSVEWSTYMKAAIADMLPEIDNLIDRAFGLIKDIRERAKASNDIPRAAAESTAGGILSTAGIDPNKGIAIDTDGLNQAIRDWQQQPVFSANTWTNFGKALWSGFSLNATPQDAEKIVSGLASKQIKEPVYPTAEQMDAAFDKANPPDPGSRAHPLQGLSASDYSDAATKIPAKDVNGTDAVQAAIDSLNKHTLATKADADAVGLGAAALAEFKAKALEAAAVAKNGGKETAEQAAKFKELEAAASAAAQALAKAQVASDISRGKQTALFTPEDLAIANQLKGLYGDDIPAAMKSSEAEALRFNATIKELGTLGQQVNSGFLVDFESKIRSGASAMDALKTAGLNALGKIADKLAQMAADNLWSNALGGSGSSGILGLLGIGGSSGAAAQAASASTLANNTGGAFFGPGFASGTDFAPGGTALVGENGPELVNLPRGSQVIPNDVLRSGGTGGGGTTVHAGSTVVIQGDASEKTVALISAALQQHDASLPMKVVAAVNDAKARRMLA